MVFTNKGWAIAGLEAQIIAENIRLGNTTASSAGEVVMAVGAAMVKSVTEPWGKGQYVEAGVRLATEGLTSGIKAPSRVMAGAKVAQEVKVGKALEMESAAKAAKAKAVLDTEKAAKVGNGIPAKAPIAKNGYLYHTDSKGRVIKAEGNLTLNKQQGRNPKAQSEAGGIDRLPSDQGGHFIGRRFNGPTDEINHFAQNGNFNQGVYKSLENGWEKTLNNGQSVRVQVSSTYIGYSLRPDILTVRHWLDDIPQNTRIFNNMPGRILPKP